jgi:CRISPR-associated protein Csm4
MLLLCRLSFTGPLRLTSGASADLSSAGWQIRSDTLSAALCSVWVELFGLDGLTISSPPFLVSSTFPWVGSDPELFWPIPRGRQPAPSDPTERKLWKKTAFASPALWSALTQSDVSAKGLQLRLDGLALSEKPGLEGEWLVRVRSVPHVTLDRVNSDSQVFSQEEVCFAEGAGLFFVAHVEDTAVPRFNGALRLLGEQGIGADRSSGRGQFDVEIVEGFHLPKSKGSSRLLLSLCWPRREEVEAGLLSDGSRFGLVKRGGWVTAPGARTAQRPGVNMLTEGSVINQGSEQVGQVARVLKKEAAPGLNHDVFRDGRGFVVPCC